MVGSTQKRLRRSLFLLFVVLTLLVGAWGALEWDVRRMENAVWDRGDFSGLEKREPLLIWVAEHRLTPEHLKGRVNGLLGDSRFHENRSGAYEFYERSMLPFEAFHENKSVDPFLMIEQLRVENSDFARGIEAQKSELFKAVSLIDEDMAMQPSRFSLEGKNYFDDFLQIKGLDAHDREVVRDLFYNASKAPKWREMEKICQTHRTTIDSLNALGVRFRINAECDPNIFGHLCYFIRLVAVDAFLAGKSDDSESAIRSLNTAYRLLGYLEQNPTLMNGLSDYSLRDQIANFLHSDNGTNLRQHLVNTHVMVEEPDQWYIRGAYHEDKKLLLETMPVTTAAEQKLRHATMRHQLDYWRKIREGVEPVDLRYLADTQSLMSIWFSEQRKFLYRRNSASYAEGRKFYASIEDISAQMIFAMTIRNQGPIWRSMQKTRARELAVLRGEIEPPEKDVEPEPLSPELQKIFTKALKEAGVSLEE